MTLPCTWNELADWCERAEGLTPLLDEALTAKLYPYDKDMARMAARGSFQPSKSLDAAMRFVPLGHWFLIGKDSPPKPWARCYDVSLLYDAPSGYGELREAITPALALCAAACRAHAYAAQVDRSPKGGNREDGFRSRERGRRRRCAHNRYGYVGSGGSLMEQNQGDIPEKRRAPDGMIWQCKACGKEAEDLYGMIGARSQGWDESCMLNAVPVPTGDLG